METNSILTANILDILFEGRNKTYGAYDLRKTYDKRIGSALGITAIAIAIFAIAVSWKNANNIRTDKYVFIFIIAGLHLFCFGSFVFKIPFKANHKISL